MDGIPHDFLTAPFPPPTPWRCEKHGTEGNSWCCPMCAIEEMEVRCMLREPNARVVFGDDWVMVIT